jgi:hypothetical protein
MFQNAQLAGVVRLHVKAGTNYPLNIPSRQVLMRIHLSYPAAHGLK